MNEAKAFLEMVRKKRDRVRRMEEALAEHTARAESVTGLALTERVQTSNQATIDATLAAIEEEKQRLEEARKELVDMTEKAKQMINLIREDEIGWEILWSRYVFGDSWAAIAGRMKYSSRTCQRYAYEGILKINQKLSHHVTSCRMKM